MFLIRKWTLALITILLLFLPLFIFCFPGKPEPYKVRTRWTLVLESIVRCFVSAICQGIARRTEFIFCFPGKPEPYKVRKEELGCSTHVSSRYSQTPTHTLTDPGRPTELFLMHTACCHFVFFSSVMELSITLVF